LDTARQFLRWSIPGSTLLVVLALVQGINVTVSRYFDLATHESVALTSAVVALATVSTVPIGFVIYQIYYRAEFKASRCGICVRDRGWEVLDYLEHDDVRECIPGVAKFLPGGNIFDASRPTEEVHVLYIFLPLYRLGKRVRSESTHLTPTFWRKKVLIPAGWESLSTPESRKKTRADYSQASKVRWRLVRSLIMLVGTDDRGKSLANEYTSLSDIYHMLGACRSAIAIGAIATPVFSLTIAPEVSLTARLAIGFAVPVACLPFYFILWRNREQALDHLINCIQAGLLGCMTPAPV
jgi:hypothetical protein